MLIDKLLKIKGHSRNIDHYKKLGYEISVRQEIEVDPQHMMEGSTAIVECKCSICGNIKKKPFREYFETTNGLTTEYYCFDCKKIKVGKTNLEKYGHENPMKSEIVKNNLKKSLLEKYGVDHYSKTDEYKRKYKESCISKYGVDNASKSLEVKKIISTKKFLEHNTLDKFKSLLEKEYEILSYTNERNFTVYHKKCNSEFTLFIGTISDRIRYKSVICSNCNPIDTLRSGRELELLDFIKNNYSGEIIENRYDIIPPLSLDVYLPEISLAIEFNGVYWHSEVFKDKYYHLNKSESCRSKGIELIHIWEDDWRDKNEIVKSIILNRINGSVNKIYARNCFISEIVDNNLIRKFLNNNHILGYASSTYKVGLFFENELVSLMIFGKKKKEMELVRFCNKINTSIPGSASKLWKYFIRNYSNIDRIITYSDIAMFSGNVYESMDFKRSIKSGPNYWWIVESTRKHRFNFNKKNLSKMTNRNGSESEIMHSMKYYRLYGCGTQKWIWARNI